MKNAFIETVERYLPLLDVELYPSRPRPGRPGRPEVFFGRGCWSEVAHDLGQVPPEDRPRFVLGLFLIVVTDQAIHANLRDLYPSWRRRNRAIKFGSPNSMRRFEQPFRILTVPVDRGLVAPEALIALVPEFIDTWIDFARGFPHTVPDLDPQAFFALLRLDSGWGFCRRRSKVVRAVVDTLDARLAEVDLRSPRVRQQRELPFEPPLPPAGRDCRDSWLIEALSDPPYVRGLVDTIVEAVREVQRSTPGRTRRR